MFRDSAETRHARLQTIYDSSLIDLEDSDVRRRDAINRSVQADPDSESVVNDDNLVTARPTRVVR